MAAHLIQRDLWGQGTAGYAERARPSQHLFSPVCWRAVAEASACCFLALSIICAQQQGGRMHIALRVTPFM